MNGGFILRQFFDVSLPITEEMVIYPGKPGPSIKRYSSVPRDKVNESILTMGSHTGTHVESRLHLCGMVEKVLLTCLLIISMGNAGFLISHL